MSLRRFIDPRVIALNLRAQQQAQFERRLSQSEKLISNVIQAYFLRERAAVLKIIRRFPLNELVSQKVELKAQDTLRVELRFEQTNRLNRTLEARIEASMRQAGVSAAQNTAVRLGADFPGFPDEAEDFIRSHVPQLVDVVNQTSLNQVTDLVAASVAEGVGRPILADRIRGLYAGFDDSRALKVARTEAGMIMSVSERAIVDRLPNRAMVRKSWLNARDERVRESHENMQTLTDPAFGGVAIPLDQPYANGLMYPRDPAGGPREIIQCRCSQLYTTGEEAAAPVQVPVVLDVGDQLTTGEITSKERMDKGSANEVDFIVLKGGRRAIFKGVKGERVDLRRGIERGTYWRREVAASDIAEIVGYDDLVPKTVARKIGGEQGSVQLFIDGAETAMESAMGSLTEGLTSDDVNRSAIFDFLMGNTDRHDGNWMIVTETKKIKLIDNGLILSERYRKDFDTFGDMFESDLLNAATNFGGDKTVITDQLKDVWLENQTEILNAMEKNGISTDAQKLFRQRMGVLKRSETMGDLEVWAKKNLEP